MKSEDNKSSISIEKHVNKMLSNEQLEAVKEAVRDTLFEYISVGDIDDSDCVDFSLGGIRVPRTCRNWIDYAYDEKNKLIEEFVEDVIKAIEI